MGKSCRDSLDHWGPVMNYGGRGRLYSYKKRGSSKGFAHAEEEGGIKGSEV